MPAAAALTLSDVPAVADRLARALADTAAERDRAGGHAAHERGLIRDSGLLRLTVPAEFGGTAGDDAARWRAHFGVLKRLAEADSALAHLYGFHHLQLASVELYGTPAQRERLLRETVDADLFWGNALNPLDRRTLATRDDQRGGWRLDGSKSFCSGAVGSDRLTVSAWHEPAQSLLIGVLPTAAPGVDVQGDWDAFGQRQTDSGSVRFEAAFVPDADVLQPPATERSAKATLRTQVAQLTLVQLFAGLARGAFDAARGYVRDHGRPWFAANVERAVDDPSVQLRVGELRVQVRAAEALSDVAVNEVAAAYAGRDRLDWQRRGEEAVAVAEAKVAAHRAALAAGSQLFELAGARATTDRLRLDRFWRNARVHTLHDPVDHKLRDLGRHALTGEAPEPTPYS